MGPDISSAQYYKAIECCPAPFCDHVFVKALFNNLQDGVRILDVDLNIMCVNRTCMERNHLEAMPQDEKCYRVFRERDVPCPGCPCMEALRTGTMERKIMEDPEDRGAGVFEVSAYPILDDDGDLIGVIELSRDISDQRTLQEKFKEETEKYKELFNNNGDAIFIRYLDEDLFEGNFMEVNCTACSLYGYSEEEFLNMSSKDVLSPVSRDILGAMREKIMDGKTVITQLYHRKKCGELFHVEAKIKPYELNGKPAIISFVRDISGRLEAEKALQSRESLYLNLFHNNHAVMLVIDPDTGDMKDANPAALGFYGYSREEILGLKGWDLNSLLPVEQMEAMRKAKAAEQNCFQFKHRLKNGEIRDVEVFTGPIELDGKKYLYSIVHDISDRIEAEDESRRLTEEILKVSRVDKLTGVFNRAYFEEILFREIDKAKRYQTCLSLIMFDLDNYKEINDSLGHMAGDMVLKRVSDAVSSSVRNSDFLARWGGDEFMILSPVRLPSAMKFAEKLRAMIEDLDCGITASFGVAEFSREDTLDQLTRRVDRALYKAKDKGRNSVCTYYDHMDLNEIN